MRSYRPVFDGCGESRRIVVVEVAAPSWHEACLVHQEEVEGGNGASTSRPAWATSLADSAPVHRGPSPARTRHSHR